MMAHLTFVHPHTFSRATVRIGHDPWLLLAGLAGAASAGLQWWSGVPLDSAWSVVILLAHGRSWRHVHTVPVLGSIGLALVSSGMSMAFSGLLLNRFIAERYRRAGWKVRHTDGELGEYSSRFLAVHELGFRDSDLMMDERARHHRMTSLMG